MRRRHRAAASRRLQHHVARKMQPDACGRLAFIEMAAALSSAEMAIGGMATISADTAGATLVGGDETVGTVAAAFLATTAAPQEIVAAQGAIRVEVGRCGDGGGGIGECEVSLRSRGRSRLHWPGA